MNLSTFQPFQQCCSLEQHLGSNTIQDARNEIIANNWKHTHSLSCLSMVTASESIASSWNCYWDEVLEYGIRGFKAFIACCLSRPLFGKRKCSVHIEVGQPYPQQLFSHHLKHFNLDTVIFWQENKNYSSLQKQFHHSIFNDTQNF